MEYKENEPEVERFLPAGKKPLITYILLAVNVLIWLFTIYYSSKYKVSSNYANFKFGAKINHLIMSGEYWRLVTPIFLHGGIIHLLVNSYSLNAVGPNVERMFGPVKFIFIYLLSGVTGNIASFFFSPNPSVGASGAIFGLLGALGYIARKSRNTFGRGLGMNIIVIIVYNLIYGFSRGGIDNAAHIGGLIGGYLGAGIAGLTSGRFFTGKRIAVLGFTIILASVFLYAGFTKPENIEAKRAYEAENIIEKGIEEFNSGKYSKSEDLARQALELDISGSNQNIKIQAIDLLTSSLINQNKPDEALEYAKILSDTYPKRGHYLLGLCYLQMDKSDLAKEELKKAIKIDPENKHVEDLLEMLGK